MKKFLPFSITAILLLVLAVPTSAQRQGPAKAAPEQVNDLRQQLNNQGEATKLKMQNQRAILSQDATFTLDEETNQVTITTPSGQERVLSNLPDQAIERMISAGVIDASDENLLEVETTTEGVFYKTRGYQKKRFLGIFPRKVAQEVSLNDETGEITTQDVAPNSLVDKVLNLLTF